MLLRYQGQRRKFSTHGKTWLHGQTHEADVLEHELHWLLANGFEVCESPKLQMIDDTPPPQIGRPLPEPVVSDTLQVAEKTPPMFPRRSRR